MAQWVEGRVAARVQWTPKLHSLTVEAAIAPGTRLVVVTNPNNPTGAVLGAAMTWA